MSDLTITIDGRAVGGEVGVGVINPATGKVFARAPDCSPEELDAAMEAAALVGSFHSIRVCVRP